jgi:Fe-Mn family superoxide dismutase
MDDHDHLTRRQFVGAAAAGMALAVARCGSGAAAAAAATPAAKTASTPGPFDLPALPWPEDALEPHISARTIGFHHGKHHQGYVDKLNAAVAGTPLAGSSLEEIVHATAGRPGDEALFDNAAQAWNHAFYFRSMKPGGGGAPGGRLSKLIDDSFGGIAAAGQFGSGWAWLVLEGERLDVTSTSNADTPIAHGTIPLVTIDVWEHAYYLDYQNRRKDYIAAWLESLVDWDFAEGNLP